MDLTLESSVQYIPGVGPARAKLLENLDIHTIKDLLWHVPFRYDDFSKISLINQVQIGETVTIKGEVISIKNSFTKTGKKLQQAKIKDTSGVMDVIWFNQMYLTTIIKTGMTIQLSGKKDWIGAKPAMISPEYEIGQTKSLHTGRLVPVYNETEGISSKWLRGKIDFALSNVLPKIQEFLPPQTLQEQHLMALGDSLNAVHFPKNNLLAIAAKERLAFDELFILLLTSFARKRYWQTTKKATPLISDTIDHFIHELPFTLTDDQKNSIEEIRNDIAQSVPMNRMLEGDVGAGKTVVAAAAMYIAHQNKKKSILMAPTQILAQQHHATISRLLHAHGISVALVMGGMQSDTNADVLIGTHALLSDAQTFTNVGFIAIDEQQRFGVKQRLLLRTKSENLTTPHILTMTATPIPRTIAQVIFGNLDLSVLETMPIGRLRIKTWVVPKEKRTPGYDWVHKQLKEHHTQAFVVCPLIEESETNSDVKAVKKEYQRLKKDIFPQYRLGLLHGQMDQHDKTNVMQKFEQHSIDILVTTPVIEVGIDIKNATIMIIEAADRFGLSQLHQLRGRVGRGEHQSYCLLFTQNENAINRLKSLETIYSGPRLAELDLSLRGPGDLLGTRQHGIPSLKIADFSNTTQIKRAQIALKKLTDADPELIAFPHLRAILDSSTIEPNDTST